MVNNKGEGATGPGSGSNAPTGCLIVLIPLLRLYRLLLK